MLADRPNQHALLPPLGIVTGVDPELARWIQAISEFVQVREGLGPNTHINDRLVTVGDLMDGEYLQKIGVAEPLQATVGGIAVSGKAPDPPTNFVVTPGAWEDILTWAWPTDADEISHVEVYRYGADSVTEATLIAYVTKPMTSYRAPVSTAEITQDRYYWIRTVKYGSAKYSTWVPKPAQGGYLVAGDDSVGERIDSLISALRGESASSYSPLTTYYSSNIVLYNGRTYRCFNDNGGAGISGIVPTNATYWERYGILMQGDVDGTATVGIDGNLVIDNSLLARHIAANQIDVTKLNLSQAFVGMTIQSNNYVSGVSGWQIDQAGNAEYNGVGTWSGSAGSIVGQGDLATQDQVSAVDLDVSIVAGGYIITNLLTASNIQAGTLNASNVNVININATNITTGNLSGARVSAGTLNADRIVAETITTDRLIDNSVTVPVFAQNPATMAIPTPDTNTNIIQASVNATGAPIKIQGRFTFWGESGIYQYGQAQWESWYVVCSYTGLWRDGTELVTYGGGVSILWVDTPPPGNHTYYIYVRKHKVSQYGTYGAWVKDRVLSLTEMKK